MAPQPLWIERRSAINRDGSGDHSEWDERAKVSDDREEDDEREQVNEDGGDVQDEPHDPEPDDEWSGDEHEPSLGAGNVEPHLTHTVLGRPAMSSVDQTHWGSGPTENREDDGGDAGSDEDERTVAGMLASGPMSDADHVNVREARERLLELVVPKSARDRDELVILNSGLAQLVVRPKIGRLR